MAIQKMIGMSNDDVKKSKKKLFLISFLLSEENDGKCFSEQELRTCYYSYKITVGETSQRIRNKQFIDFSDVTYAIDIIKSFYGREFIWNPSTRSLEERRSQK